MTNDNETVEQVCETMKEPSIYKGRFPASFFDGEFREFADRILAAYKREIAAMRYIVRRLTPVECARLMGLPDRWTIPAFRQDEITDALVAEFVEIHNTFNRIMAEYGKANQDQGHDEHLDEPPKPPKPKTAKHVRKWLEKIANPATCPDAPRYKACGNGMATNQPRWILLRLLSADAGKNQNSICSRPWRSPGKP